ncbi:MAG: hypothetical protein ACKVPX_07065 [Myxococcaceae bacterium]
MSHNSKQVWVLHSDQALIDRIRESLEALADVSLRVASPSGPLPDTFDTVPRLVLAEASYARRLLKELDARIPSVMRLFLCRMSDAAAVQGLVRLAGEGHGFQTLDDSLPAYQLNHYLVSLLHGRLAGRVSPPPASTLSAEFEISGRRFRSRVVDVASQGLGLAVDLESPIELLAPKTSLRHLRITTADDTLLLESTNATIRHLQVSRDANKSFFRVGIALGPLERHEVGGQEFSPDLIKDPVRILSLLRRAVLRQGAFQLRPPDALQANIAVQAEELVHLPHGRMGLKLRAPTALEAFDGDIFDLHFDFGGQGFWGATAVIDPTAPSQILVSIPKVLRQQHRRLTPRFAPPSAESVVITFVSPLTGERLVRRVLDLHSGGVSFATDEEREPFPPGLQLSDITLQFSSGRKFSVKGVVRGSRVLTDDCGISIAGLVKPRRCGVSLTQVSESLREAVLSAYVASNYPGIKDAGELPFSQIWDFMIEMERFSPDYPLNHGPHVARLAEVQSTLGRARGRLGRSFAQTHDGKLVGYVGGLRMYSNTWLVQHLAVNPGFHRRDTISQRLTSLSVEYGEALPDIEFIRYDWFTANRWPHRMSMWLSNNLSTPGLTQIRFVNDVRLATRLPDPATSLPRVRPAAEADLRWLETYLKREGDAVSIRSEDLSVSEMLMRTAADQFEHAGLSRSRSIFVVDGENEPLAFALAETGTPGLCWAEFTNAFRFMVPDPSTLHANVAREALARHCVRFYREQGRELVASLCADEDLPLLEALGFRAFGRLGEFTFHKSLVRRWQTLVTAMFDRLGARDLPIRPPAALTDRAA